MARLMYARSLVPSDASMSLRISSSDNASASTSASLRWAYSVTSVMATLHHIPTRQWGDPSGEKAGRRAMTALDTTGLWKSHAKTHSVPGPRRLLHRRTPNVSVTKRGCTISTPRWPNRYVRHPGIQYLPSGAVPARTATGRRSLPSCGPSRGVQRHLAPRPSCHLFGTAVRLLPRRLGLLANRDNPSADHQRHALEHEQRGCPIPEDPVDQCREDDDHIDERTNLHRRGVAVCENDENLTYKQRQPDTEQVDRRPHRERFPIDQREGSDQHGGKEKVGKRILGIGSGVPRQPTNISATARKNAPASANSAPMLNSWWWG